MAEIHLIKKGGKVPEDLLKIASKMRVKTARVECIGAVRQVELAYYNHQKRKYEVKLFEEDMEVLTMLGNICMMDDKLLLHMHGTFGRRDFNVVGGHINRAVADPFLEVVLTPTVNVAYRKYDEELKLNAIKKIV